MVALFAVLAFLGLGMQGVSIYQASHPAPVVQQPTAQVQQAASEATPAPVVAQAQQ